VLAALVGARRRNAMRGPKKASSHADTLPPMTFTLSELESAFRAGRGRDTTCLDAATVARWTSDNPAHGQCGPTALVMQDLLGGNLLIADVTGGDDESTHSGVAK